jgi:lysosomal acid lipase/cholesteryl ester hydrolase
LLANNGFDVWIANVRGSKFSMRHKSADPKEREFWRFSFHEIGIFDLSAFIDYILNLTKKPSLYFVGHNQGTTALMVLLSMRPEFNAKILQAHLMAPIAFMDYPHPLLSFGVEDNIKSNQFLGNFNFFSLINFANLIIDNYCADKSFASLNYCTNLWFFLFGRNLNQTEINPQMLLDVPKYISPTVSMRQWNHFLQLAQSGKFQSYDRSGSANKFNSLFSVPTEYNLANVKAPLFFYHAAEDLVVSRLVCTSK